MRTQKFRRFHASRIYAHRAPHRPDHGWHHGCAGGTQPGRDHRRLPQARGAEAIRTGNSVHLTLDNSGACARPAHGAAADGWTLVRSDGNQLHTVTRGDLGPGVCVQSTGDASILINSRGLLGPFENRTVWVSYRGRADTITVSVLGRVLRRY